jgi:hypothetical protein
MTSLDYLWALQQTRRQFFGRAATGIGTAALASLLQPELFAKAGKGIWRRAAISRGCIFRPKRST